MELKYGQAIPPVPNSSDFYVALVNTPGNAAPATDCDYNFYAGAGDFKGVRVDFDYVPMKAVLILTWVDSGKVGQDMQLQDQAYAPIDNSYKDVHIQSLFLFQ